MTGTRRAMVAAVLVVGFGAGLGGCGGDEDPVADPSSPTSSTASSSPPRGTASGASGSASATPSSGKVTEEQFVALWVKSYNTMVSTGRTGQFLDLAASQCDACSSLAAVVGGFYENGGSVQGGHLFNLRDIRPSGTWDGEDQLDFKVDTKPAKVLDGNGKIVKTYEATHASSFNLVLRPTGKTWRAIHMGRNPM